MPGQIRIQHSESIAHIVFDHPERRNAITTVMWKAIPDIVEALAEDPDVRVVIIRGAGSEAFVSGADISEFEETRTGDAGREYDATTARAFETLRSLDKPLIASIHGFCIGGGAALALTADLRYGSKDAIFALPPARLGLGYHTAGVEALVRTVGFSGAADLLFSARRVSAADALRMGLLNDVFEGGELDEAVTRVARMIAANAPLSIRSAKTNLRELAKPLPQRDVEAMQASIERCYQSEDFKEGVQAFLEKRRPRFRGC